MSAAQSQMITPPPESPGKSAFDIVSHYQSLLKNDAELNAPIAAIESLIALLSASPPSTVSETLSLIEEYVLKLKNSIHHPLPLSAGTDLFQRYIISALQSGSNDDFDAIRSHLLANSKLFVERAKEARGSIARTAKQLIQDNSTVLTCGSSRVVSAVVEATASDGVPFRFVQVQNSTQTLEPLAKVLMKQLRDHGNPVAVTDFRALAVAVSCASLILIGAECVVENGGIVSSLGTHQVAIIAKAMQKPLYVAVESYKFVRKYPLGSDDLGIESSVLNFKPRADASTEQISNTTSAAPLVGTSQEERPQARELDYTPPELITGLITESGLKSPDFVSEELLKLWS